MSRVAVATNEPVQPTKRRSATRVRRDAIIARDGPLCALAGCSAVGVELDHRVALALGGLDELSNWQLLCPVHHRAKTAIDVRIIAKVNRLLRRLDGTRRERKPIPSPVKPWAKGQKLRSRGFPKTKSAQYLKGEG